MGRFSKLLSDVTAPTSPASPRVKTAEEGSPQELIAVVASKPLEDAADEQPEAPVTPAAPVAPVKAAQSSDQDDMLDIKIKMHSRLIDEIDLAALDGMETADLQAQVHAIVTEMVQEDRLKLNTTEIKNLCSGIYDEMTGLGPLEPILADDSISDILINGHEQVYIERRGELELSKVRFADEAHLLRIINRIVSTVGRRVDESQPLCDARLLDGSRVNVAIAPIAVDGPLVSIRKFSKTPFTLDKLVEFEAIPDVVAQFLWAACKARVTILISGGTGSGKTTLLNALSQSISHKERLITIEDAAELQLQQPHVARMETRPQISKARAKFVNAAL